MGPANIAAQVSLIGSELVRRTEELGVAVASAIKAGVDFYDRAGVISYDELVQSCTANIKFLLSGLAGSPSFDTTPAADTGDARARTGVPLPAVMAAYRVGSHYLWQALHEIVAAHDDISRRALLAATERIWQAQDVYTEAMVAAYRQRAAQQIVEDEAERAALVEALFTGVAAPGRSLYEIADLLRLPTQGPYVVIAAKTPELGRHAMPGIEDKLRSLDIYSAWRLLPELQVGIVHLPSADARPNLLALAERLTSAGVGASPPFDALSDVGTALRYARIAVQGTTEDQPVVAFDNSVLGIAALTDPEINGRLATAVLGRLDELPDEERQTLYQTFKVWAAQRGSVSAAAAALFCHPNTVRYRLRRIEEHTGRSTSAPLDVAELCLAFEISSKLP